MIDINTIHQSFLLYCRLKAHHVLITGPYVSLILLLTVIQLTSDVSTMFTSLMLLDVLVKNI